MVENGLQPHIIKMSKEMVSSVRCARQKYAEFLEAKKNEKVVTAKGVKRTAIQEDIDAASKRKQE